MKKLILIALLCMSALSFAETKVEASSGLDVLERIVGMKQTYSAASSLDAKVFEVLAGDGVNSTRMILVLSNGLNDSKVFEFDYLMMYEVTRITFLAKDVIVVNYTQENFDANGNVTKTKLKRSITIKVQRNADGSIADTIKY